MNGDEQQKNPTENPNSNDGASSDQQINIPDRGAFSLSMADVPDSPEYEKLKTFEKQIRWMSPDLKPRNNSLDGPSELPDLELAYPKTTPSGCEDKLPSLIAPEDDSNSPDDIPLTSTALTCEEGKTVEELVRQIDEIDVIPPEKREARRPESTLQQVETTVQEIVEQVEQTVQETMKEVENVVQETLQQIEISVEKTLDEVEINVPESLQSAETTSDGSFELVEHEEKEYVSAQGPQEVDPLSVVAGQEDTVEDVAQQSVENVENAAAESTQGADHPVVIKDGNMEAPANESDTTSQSPRHQESQDPPSVAQEAAPDTVPACDTCGTSADPVETVTLEQVQATTLQEVAVEEVKVQELTVEEVETSVHKTVEVIVDVVENKVDEEISKVVTEIVTDQLQSKSSSENPENFQEDSDRELTNKSSDENPQASTNEGETAEGMRSSESNKDEKESREEVSLSAESEVANSCSLLAETTPPELHQVKTQVDLATESVMTEQQPDAADSVDGSTIQEVSSSEQEQTVSVPEATEISAGTDDVSKEVIPESESAIERSAEAEVEASENTRANEGSHGVGENEAIVNEADPVDSLAAANEVKNSEGDRVAVEGEASEDDSPAGNPSLIEENPNTQPGDDIANAQLSDAGRATGKEETEQLSTERETSADCSGVVGSDETPKPNTSEDAAKSDSKEVGAGEGGVAATPDQGYETDMMSTPVTVASETPLVSDTPVTAPSDTPLVSDTPLALATSEETDPQPLFSQSQQQTSEFQEDENMQSLASESSCTLMMTAQDDLDEDTTAFASVATDVDVSMYTVDAVSLDDDDLATVAEDDGSLASQEEKSVIFSPQPTAAATNLASVTNTLDAIPITPVISSPAPPSITAPIDDGSGEGTRAFLTEVEVIAPEPSPAPEPVPAVPVPPSAPTDTSSIDVERGKVRDRSQPPPSVTSSTSARTIGGATGTRSSQRGLTRAATAVPMPPEPILSYAHVGCIAVVALVAIYFFFCI